MDHQDSLSIISNFRIDEEERFLRMKDSFNSFSSIDSDNWVINIRGKYKEEAALFLKNKLGKKLSLTFLDSKNDWSKDSLSVFSNIKSDYVLYWVEDHLNLVKPQIFSNLIEEMRLTGSKILHYSWWGYYKKVAPYRDLIKVNKKELLTTYSILRSDVKKVVRYEKDNYIISLCGIMETNFFLDILKSKKPFPNRWPKSTPFNFEKRITDKSFLPIKISIPNFELFASIDDDISGVKTSLISRELYPNRVGNISRTRKKTSFQRFFFKTKLYNLLYQIKWYIVRVIKYS